MYSVSGLVELRTISFWKMSSLWLVIPAHYPSTDGAYMRLHAGLLWGSVFLQCREHGGLVLGHLKPALSGFCDLKI